MIIIPSCSYSFGESAIPSTFHFPTDLDYSVSLVDSIKSLPQGGINVLKSSIDSININNLTTALNLPIDSARIGIETLVENVLGKITGNAGIENIPYESVVKMASEVASAVDKFVKGKIGAGVTQLVSTAVETVSSLFGSICEAVPIIGEIVAFLVEYLIGAFMSEETIQKAVQEAKAAAEQRCYDKLDPLCRSLIQNESPISAAESFVPSDLFREIAYRYHSGQRLPFSFASMFILLCGHQTDGFGIPKGEYIPIRDASLKYHLRKSSDEIGIPTHTQRKLWLLCKSLMNSVANPHGATVVGDGGRVAFAVMLDIVRNEIHSGRVTQHFLTDLSSWLTSKAKVTTTYCPGDNVAGHCGQVQCSCSDRNMVDLSSAFFTHGSAKGLIDQYFDSIRSGFIDQNGNWIIKPKSASFIRNIPKNGFVIFTPAQAKKLDDKVKKSVSAKSNIISKQSKLSSTDYAIIVSGTVAASWLTWNGVKHFVPRSK